MSRQYITMTMGGERRVLIVERYAERCYTANGMVEANTFQIHFATEAIRGEGKTFEDAIERLVHNIDFRRVMNHMSEQMFTLKGDVSWYKGVNEQLVEAGYGE